MSGHLERYDGALFITAFRSTIPSEAGGRRRAAARFISRLPRRQAVLAGAAYLGFALAITWPFAIAPGSTLFGGVGSDLTAAVVRFRELADAAQPPFLPGRMPDLDAPEGLTTQWALEFSSLPSSTLLWLSSLAFGGIAGYGLLPIVNFAGSALAMFLLARWLTGSAGAGFVAGVAFGFWPFAYSSANVPFGSGFILVILVWRMLVVLREPTIRNGLIAGLAGVLVVAWTQYWILIGGVLYAVLAGFVLLRARSRGQTASQLRAQAAAGAVVACWLIAVAIIGSVSGFTDVPVRSGDDSVFYSARVPMYVVPGPHHPLLDGATAGFLRERYFTPGATAIYAPIYVGLTTLALALAGLALTARDRVTRRSDNGSGEIVFLGVALVLVAGVFSGPPEVQVLGTTIKTPAGLVADFTSVFRVASRFAILVMLGLCLLLSVGVSSILRGRSRAAGAVVVSVLAVLVAVDLWSREPPGPTDVHYPSVLTRLADRPAGIVIEYPVLAAVNSGSDTTFNQQAHGNPIVNGSRRDTPSESWKLELQALQDPRTVSELARVGVRYVVVRELDLAAQGVPAAGSQIAGLRLLDRDSYGALYEVTARPARTAVHAMSGFTLPEGDPVRFIRWMTRSEGEIRVTAGCARCEGDLRFTAGTFATPRRLTVLNEAGEVVARETISSAGQSVRVPVRFERTTVVTLQIDPPPQAPADLDPANPDTRPLGIFVSYPIRFDERHGVPRRRQG